MEELISVVIPTYKRPFKTVLKAINSVLNQTYNNIEVIIVDDNPKGDNNKIEIKSNIQNINDNRLKYIQHKNNKGACAARNTGIQNSNGDIIAFLDDDDEWLPLKLEKQYKKFQNPSVGLVYCSYIVCKNGEKTVKKSTKRGSMFKELLYTNFIGSTSSVIVRKKSLLESGLFDTNLPASQDYDLYLRISKKYLIDVVEEPLAIHYKHNGERISDDPYKKLIARKYIYKKYKNYIEKNPKINCEKYLLLAHSFSLVDNKKEKWKHWWKALFAHPIPSKRFLKLTVKIWFNL